MKHKYPECEKLDKYFDYINSERNRQLVLIIPRDYKLKYQTIKVTLPYGYNAGLVIGKGGENIRYSLDRLNQEYGTEFTRIILN